MRLIDADALLLRIDCHGTNKFGMLDEDIREYISKQPTIDPESLQLQWIPVTERLPESSQDVLITRRTKTGTVRVTKAFYISSDDEGIWVSERGTDTTGVIAWMPMPEPYTPEGKDGNG